MSAIKNVVIAGATGNLGPPIFKALVDSAKFNITVFRRKGSKSTFPSSVKVVDVDYSSVDALAAALSGQDAVVSTLAIEDPTPQDNLIEAAASAGIQRFVPSEFGSDIANPKTAALPVFQGKITAHAKLDAIAKSSALSYTLIRNNAFLDWGLKVGFIFDAKDGKPNLFNGGDVVFSATSLPAIGQAVVGVLLHPAETANRAVYIREIDLTQNQLFSIAKRIFPEKTWQPVAVSTADLRAKSLEEIKSGNINGGTFFNLIPSAIFEEGYGGKFENLDNELLGVQDKTLEDVEKIWRSLL